MPPGKGQWVGLDIGTQSIKIITFEKTKNRWLLKNYQYLQTTGNWEEDPVGYEKWVQETLKKSVNQMGLAGAWVSNPLSGTQVALRKMSFPDMPLEEVKEAVRFQGKAAFPFPLDNAVVDVARVGMSQEKKDSQQEVLAAAAIRDLVNQRVTLLKNLNLRPLCLSLVPLALKKAYLLSAGRPVNESVALIDIGSHASTIAMIQNEEVVFSREIGLGGGHFTETLMDLSRSVQSGKPLTYEDAERTKIMYGIPNPGLEQEQTEEGIPLEGIREGLMPVVDRLIMEIDRSFGYFKTQAENQTIDRILLSGGGALLKGLPKALERSFSIPIAEYNLWDNLEIDPGINGEALGREYPLFIIAIGLATDDRPTVNLLPYTRQSSQQAFWETGKKALAYGLLPVVFTGFLAYQVLSVRSELSQLDKKISTRQGELTLLEKSRNELDKLRQQENDLDQKLSVYPPKMVEKTPVQEILRRISQKVPPNITLTSFSLVMDPVKEVKPVENKANEKEQVKQTGPGPQNGPRPKSEGNIQLKGVAYGPGDEVLRSLAAFSQGLETVGYFSGVRLEDVKRNDTFKTPAADFSLSV
ncbi:MAG: type IV pilus assembly protein PilM, partial [Desulfobacteraceae bacterium]